MKLLVFAHTPPPHHGQSYMVKQMLDGFGGDQRGKSIPVPSPHGVACYHINARLSTDLEEIGAWRVGKVLRLPWYCAQAVWCRYRYGVTTLYYVPAPGRRAALYRDWLVMALCRPFFNKLVLHWHAAGLGRWLEQECPGWVRKWTFRALGRSDLSIIQSDFNRSDAEILGARAAIRVNCGIPDPCPNYEQAILPRRRTRLAARKVLLSGRALAGTDLAGTGAAPEVFKVLFLAHCTREKGLFDTLEGVALANRRLADENCAIRVHLEVAGAFIEPGERREFEERIRRDDLRAGTADSRPSASLHSVVTYAGFVSGDGKHQAFAGSDCFCLPTYFHAESFGVAVAEAMAYGLPVLTSRWRSMPELLPPDYPGLVSPRSPAQIAEALRALMTSDGRFLRQHYLGHFTLNQYLDGLAVALRTCGA